MFRTNEKKFFFFLIDFKLFKRLNKIGLPASIHRIRDNSNLKQFAMTALSKLGIFLDFECFNRETIAAVLSNVKL